MIIVKLEGGHSNQLFQYATGRRLAHKLGVELFMDKTWFSEIVSGDTPREYELEDYKIQQNFIAREKFVIASAKDSGIKIKLYNLTKARAKPRINHYREIGHSFDKKILELPDNTYLDGFWQNERYFLDIRGILLSELELKNAPSPKNSKLLDQIKSSESISIHVRRGDYVTNKLTNKFHGLIPAEYYSAALQMIRSKVPSKDLKLFVFSNDIAWCKQNLKFKEQTFFVEGNKKGSEDMRLMKQCKHNIMANSSFSWWGAWLNQNPQKIAIAPKRWFQDKKTNKETEIVPKSWIRI